MSAYPFSPLMNAHFSQSQGASAKLGIHPASSSNAGYEEMSFTQLGGATMVEFFVARHRWIPTLTTPRFSNSYSRSQPSIAKGGYLDITYAGN